MEIGKQRRQNADRDSLKAQYLDNLDLQKAASKKFAKKHARHLNLFTTFQPNVENNLPRPKEGGGSAGSSEEEEPEKKSAPVGSLSSEADVDVELAAGRV